jgi:hypothetical protein
MAIFRFWGGNSPNNLNFLFTNHGGFGRMAGLTTTAYGGYLLNMR